MPCTEGHVDCQRQGKIMRCVFNSKDKQHVHANAATDNEPASESISEDHEKISRDEMWLWHTYRHTHAGLYCQRPESALGTAD